MMPFICKFLWSAKKDGGSSSLSDRVSHTQCSLDSGEKHGWKPQTMKPAVLVPFALLCLAFIAILEFLAKKSLSNNALAIAKDADSFPTHVIFAQSYLSTIIATIFGFAWSWIDLDVKRMEPWLQLSRSRGATGQDSLLLEYPYGFLPVVPFIAAKKKHWATFLAGTITPLIFWAITPLQSAIFSAIPITLERDVQIRYPDRIMDLPLQSSVLDLSVLNQQYAINWLNHTYDLWQEPTFALTPFQVFRGNAHEFGVGDSLIGSTTKFWAELECEHAGIWVPEDYDINMNVTYENDFGCEALDFQFTGEGYVMGYFGYHDSNNLGWSMANFHCPDTLTNHTLTVWMGPPKDGSNIKRDIAATLCTPRYYKQMVTASATSEEHGSNCHVIEPLGAQEPLSPSEFNTSAFENILLAGTATGAFQDVVSWANVTRSTRIREQNVTEDFGALVDTIVALRRHPLNAYSDPAKLAEAVQDAYQSVFSVAMNFVKVDAEEPSFSAGKVTGPRYGIVVSRAFSVAVETLLFVVAVLTTLLAWFSHKSVSMLSTDPGSMASLVKMIHGSEDVLQKFSGTGHLPIGALSDGLAQQRFQLICGCQDPSRGTSIRVLKSEDLHKRENDGVQSCNKPITDGSYIPVTPFSFRRVTGLAMVLLLIVAMLVLALLKQSEKDSQGLSSPSSYDDINSFLTDLLPMAFAVLLEPILVLLNRLMCALQPFNDLVSQRQSRKRAGNSLTRRYAAIPPQLAIWNATLSRHYYLASMCAIALLVNLLAVSLGGLFYSKPIVLDEPVDLTVMKLPTLSDDARRNDYLEPGMDELWPHRVEAWQLAKMELQMGMPLQPWTSEEYVFMPLGVPTNGDHSKSVFSSTTVGIGVEPSCHALGPIESTDALPVLDVSSYFTADHLQDCSKYYQQQTTLPSGNVSFAEGPLFASGVGVLAQDAMPGVCWEPFIYTWSRTDSNDTAAADMTSSFVLCSPVIKTAIFDISFENSGRIQSAQAIGESEIWDPDRIVVHNETILGQMNQSLKSLAVWSNDTQRLGNFDRILMQPENTHYWDSPFLLPDMGGFLPEVERVYKLYFSQYMSLRLDEFEDAANETPVRSREGTPQLRLFLSDPSLIISLTVIALQTIVLLVLYIRAFKTFLPRLPTSIGSLMAYVAASSVVRDYATKGIDPTRMLGFGEFVDDDGNTQLGIDYAEKVVPVNVDELRERKTSVVGDETRKRRQWFGGTKKAQDAT